MFTFTNCNKIFFEILALLAIVALTTGQRSSNTSLETVQRAIPMIQLVYKDFCDGFMMESLRNQLKDNSPAMQLPIFCIPYLYFKRPNQDTNPGQSCGCKMTRWDTGLPADAPPGIPFPPNIMPRGVCIAYKCASLTSVEMPKSCMCKTHLIPPLPNTKACKCSLTCVTPPSGSTGIRSGRALPYQSPQLDCVFSIEPEDIATAADFLKPPLECECNIQKSVEKATCDCYEKTRILQ